MVYIYFVRYFNIERIADASRKESLFPRKKLMRGVKKKKPWLMMYRTETPPILSFNPERCLISLIRKASRPSAHPV